MSARVKYGVGVGLVALVCVLSFALTASANRGDGALGEVYVISQGLYYDTFVSAQVLPNKGPFQKLEDGVTEYGPGDPGYLGGRWWIDNPDEGEVGYPDDADTFLLCPLLPPGRPWSNQ